MATRARIETIACPAATTKGCKLGGGVIDDRQFAVRSQPSIVRTQGEAAICWDWIVVDGPQLHDATPMPSKTIAMPMTERMG